MVSRPRRRSPNRAAFIPRKLSSAPDRAAVIDPGALPAGVVTMNATVQFKDPGTNEIEEDTITFPETADLERKRIPILAPIGTA